MADNIIIKDANDVNVTVRTTDNAGVHTHHTIVDSSVLPTGAATEAKQDDIVTEGQNAVTELQQIEAALDKVTGKTQLNNFGSALNAIDTENTTPVATNGAPAAIIPALTAGKKAAVQRIEFTETDAGTAGGDGKLQVGDVVTVQYKEETSLDIIFQRSFTVQAVGDIENRVLSIEPSHPVKLGTADKRLFIEILCKDSGGTPRARNITGFSNVWYHEED